MQRPKSQTSATALASLLMLSLDMAGGAVSSEPLAPLPEASASTIGYATPAAALNDLRSRPGVVVTNRDGWIIVDDPATKTIWSFSPASYPAYPAAVKRQVVQDGAGISIKMDILCGASKAACDELVRTYQDLNARTKAALQAGH
jgi:hypothetical protein